MLPPVLLRYNIRHQQKALWASYGSQFINLGVDMTGILSFKEIEQQYDGEWVLIAYTEVDLNLKPIAGEVLAHSTDRDVVYEALAQRGDRGVAIECFVQSPEDLAFIL